MTKLEERRLTPLFATPVLEHLWEDTDALNASLRELILAREQASPGITYSNVGGWHSNSDFETWGEPATQLLRRIGAAINQATAEYFRTFGGMRQILWRLTTWANVNRTGDYNRSHVHPNATWSGVYYVDEGDAPADRSDSGVLVLHHPTPAIAQTFLVEATRALHEVRPRAGLMLVFPGYLSHEVRPYLGQRPRISVAFNASIEPNPERVLAAHRRGAAPS